MISASSYYHKFFRRVMSRHSIHIIAAAEYQAPMCTGKRIFTVKTTAPSSFQPTLTQWRKVFIIAAVVYTVDAILYLLFASGDEQSWNSVPEAADPESGGAPEATQQKGGSGDAFKESGVLRGVFVQGEPREDAAAQQRERPEGKGASRGSEKAVLQSKPSGDDAGHTNRAYCSTEGE